MVTNLSIFLFGRKLQLHAMHEMTKPSAGTNTTNLREFFSSGVWRVTQFVLVKYYVTGQMILGEAPVIHLIQEPVDLRWGQKNK